MLVKKLIVDEDFNLANDELNLIETVADAFHSR
jgi:hypothetical protein